MSYKKVGWEDAPSSNTPILSVSLNQMDDGIEKANKGIVFSYSATFTSDGVLKNTTSTEALGTGSFATSQTDIVTVFVADNVTKINSGTFGGCTSLKTIYIDNTVGNVEIVSGAVHDGVSIVYSNDDNFINVNELLTSAIKSLKSSVNTNRTDWENRATSIEAQHKTDIDDLKSNKLDNTDFTDYKNTTADTLTSHNVRLAELKGGIADLSDGYLKIDTEYTSGKVNPADGSIVEPYDTAVKSAKLNLDKYASVVFTSTKLNLMLFEYDENNKYIKQIANTVKSFAFNPTVGHTYVIQWWYGGTDFSDLKTDISVMGKCVLTETDKKNFNYVENPTCVLDMPDKLFIQKGKKLELFKYGMFYINKEYVPNEYNVRVVNIDNYATQYSDKIVVSCPSNFSGTEIKGTSDLPLFQLLNRHGKVIDSKRVHIYVTDVSSITDDTRTVMYLGDSLTGMGIRSGETAKTLSEILPSTKLIGRSIGQGSGNKFTGTGGYSWANYTENPNTLPSAYPNNYLWDDRYNNISMKYFVKKVLNETQLDYLVILLGWNDYENGAFASKFNWSDLKMRAKKLIENTHLHFPNCKIILESYHYGYPFARKAYGNTMSQIRHNKYIYDLNKLYQSIANEYDYVEFVQMSIQIDVLHNMSMAEELVNSRSTETEKYCTDLVHPADIGFYQYSDAEVNALLYLMSN